MELLDHGYLTSASLDCVKLFPKGLYAFIPNHLCIRVCIVSNLCQYLTLQDLRIVASFFNQHFKLKLYFAVPKVFFGLDIKKYFILIFLVSYFFKYIKYLTLNSDNPNYEVFVSLIQLYDISAQSSLLVFASLFYL